MPNNYFIFKGISSEKYKNIVVSELPPISKPAKRNTLTYVDGVDGATVTENGYEMQTKPVKIGLTTDENIDELLTWLSGSGDVIFSNEPRKVYKGWILNAYEFARLGRRMKNATISFLCSPYKYVRDEQPVVITSNGTYNIYNAGTEKALPLIDVESTSSVMLRVNGTEYICSLTMTPTFNKITLDSEAQNAFVTGTSTLKNSIMTGDFPKFKPGNNTLQVSGITKATVNIRSRFI